MIDEAKEATPEELAEMGVETGEPVISEAEPPRVPIEEVDDLPGEPASDIKIMVDGVPMRERISVIDQRAEGVVTDASNSASTLIVMGISLAALEADDSVKTLSDGSPIIATCWPVTFSTEGLGRIGTAEALRETLLIEREKAAFRADLEFKGLALASELQRGLGVPLSPARSMAADETPRLGLLPPPMPETSPDGAPERADAVILPLPAPEPDQG